MDWGLIINAVLALLVSGYIIRHVFQEIKAKTFKKKDITLIFLGVVYLLFTGSFLLGSFNVFHLGDIDIWILYTATLFLQTISLMIILYQSTRDRKVFHLLVAYIIPVPLILLKISFLHLIVPISLLVTLLTFLIFSRNHERTFRFLIPYTALSIAAYLATILWPSIILMTIAFSTLLYILFMASFTKSLLKGDQMLMVSSHEPESPLLHFLKHFVFIIIITTFVFIGTVSFHEIGHLVFTQSDACEGTRIVYELNAFPHTEVECGSTSAQTKWILGGIGLPFVVAVLLLFGGGVSIKEIALQITGFNLILSYLDIIALGLSNVVALFALVLGIILSLVSLALLVKSRIL